MEGFEKEEERLKTRRKFLATVGVALPTTVLGQEKQLKRSRWDLIFGGGETRKPLFKPEPRNWKNDTITAAWIGSSSATRAISGTSMAAPHVAGVAALYLSAHPSATPQQVASAVIGNATLEVVQNALDSPNRLLFSSY